MTLRANVFGRSCDNVVTRGRLKQVGINPAVIYAFEQTGLLVTEENQNRIPEKDLAEWYAAIDEYEARNDDDDESLLLEPDVAVSYNETPMDDMTPNEMRGMAINPIFTGLGPYPRIVSDEDWVENCKRLLQEDGAEQFLVNLLYVLREVLGTEEDFDDEDDLDDEWPA